MTVSLGHPPPKHAEIYNPSSLNLRLKAALSLARDTNLGISEGLMPLFGCLPASLCCKSLAAPGSLGMEVKHEPVTRVDRPRLLICDADAEHVRHLSEALRSSYACTVAFSAEEALQVVRVATPDVLLVDRDMPEISGIEVLHLAKTIDPHLEVILMVQGQPLPEDFAVALQERAAAVLSKPVDIRELRKTLEKALSYRTRLRLSQPGFTAETADQRLLRLSDRQYEVLKLLSDGLSTKDISGHLGISEKSVRNACSQIYALLGVESKTQAALVMRAATPKRGNDG